MAAVLVSIGGMIGATFVKSPAQQAAQTKPPPPTLLTSPVVAQVVRSSVVLRGTVDVAESEKITPAAEVGANLLVVTSVAVGVGAQVRDGQVILAVSGRPLYVLQGAFPAYRDMVPGDQGPDIAQLQSALRLLGYSMGNDARGLFGVGTEAAVSAYYARIGFPPAITGGGSPSGSAQPSSSGSAFVPMSEVAFVPSLPAEVIALGGGVGTIVSPPLVTLATGGLIVQGQLDPSQAGLIRTGMTADISDSLTGYTGSGQVSAIGSLTGAAQEAPYIPVTITPGNDLPLSELQANVELQIVSASTNGPVLAAPEAAITANAAGQTFVVVSGQRGGSRRVEVRTGVSGSGMVAVTPINGALAPGEQVVTGQ